MWNTIKRSIRDAGPSGAVLHVCVALCSIGLALTHAEPTQQYFYAAILTAGYLWGVISIGTIEPAPDAAAHKRSAAWCSAFFHGLLFVGLATLIAAAIIITITERSLLDQHNDEQSHRLMRNAELMICVILFVALCTAFSAGAFVRSWTPNNLRAAMAWIIILPGAFAALRFVQQQSLDLSLRDLLPLILALTALLALSAWICFALTPAAWTAGRRCISAGLPLIIVTLYIWVSLLLWDVDRWSKPSPEHLGGIASATVLSHGLVELHIRDFRSGDHTFMLGGETGRRRYLGRFAQIAGTSFSIKDAPPCAEVFYSTYEPGKPRVGHTWNLSSHTDYALPEMVLPPGAQEFGIVSRPSWSTTKNQRWRLAVCPREFQDGEGGYGLNIFDESGERAFRIPMARPIGFHELDDGRLMVLRPFIAEPALKWSTRWVIVDLETKSQSTDSVDGCLLAVSGNAQKAIVLKPVDGTKPRALDLELVDLATHEHRVLLTPTELASAAGMRGMQFNDSATLPPQPWQTSFANVRTASDFSKLIWLTGERDGEFQKITLHEMDLENGTRRVIADASALPVIFVDERAGLKRERRDGHDTFEIEQLSTDETSAILRIGQRLYSVELSSGTVTPWFDPAGIQAVPDNQGRRWFSPSGTRAVFEMWDRATDDRLIWPTLQADTAAATIERFAAEKNHGELSPEPGLYVFEPGKRPFWIGNFLQFAGWLDEKRVIVCDESKCFVITLEDLSRRELFDIEDPAMLTDHW